VHARSDEHLIEQAFGTERKPNVAVVKEHLNLKNELIDGKCPRRRMRLTWRRLKTIESAISPK
jgi:hypothetical protein